MTALEKYIIAIPTYNRYDVISKKTLLTLKEGGVASASIYLFVANKAQEKLYKQAVPKELYGKIVVGKLGITNQRNYIVKYFPEGQYVVSCDDDIEAVEALKDGKLVKINDINRFFLYAYEILVKEELYIYGIYPVHNPFFMKQGYTDGLKFIIGVLYGFINRHNKQLVVTSPVKEDYQLSILYFKIDGGVIRFNDVTVKTKFNAKGGIGEDRFVMNKQSAEYLVKQYPDIVKIKHRKNGMTEINLKALKRSDPKKPIIGKGIDTTANQIARLKLNKPTQKFINNSLLPLISNTTIQITKSRQNISGIGRSQPFGYGNKIAREFGEYRNNKTYPELWEALVTLGKAIVPDYIPWTGIQVNHNYESKKHTDGKNRGLSLAVSFGDFTGGELVIEDKEYQTKLHPVIFNGALREHFNKPITGNRYSLVYFVSAPSKYSDDDILNLHNEILNTVE